METARKLQSTQHLVRLGNLPPNADPKNLGNFLDEAFGKTDYVRTFPHVFRSGNEQRFVTATNDKTGELLALCATHPLNWMHQHQHIRAVCIGSVATCPKARGQGLATLVVTEAERRARKEGFDFSVLFSDIGSLYANLGYSHLGTESFAIFPPATTGVALDPNSTAVYSHARRNISGWAHKPACAASRQERNAIWQLLNRAKGESHISFDEFEHLLTIPRMDLVFVTSTEGLVVAAGFSGKGLDFQEVFHSVVFATPEDLACLLRNFRRNNQETGFLFLLPPLNPDVRALFKDVREVPSSLWHKPLNTKIISAEEQRTLLTSQHLYIRGIQSA